jgi:hypothetical protein
MAAEGTGYWEIRFPPFAAYSSDKQLEMITAQINITTK